MTKTVHLPEEFSLGPRPLDICDDEDRLLYRLEAVDTVAIREWELKDSNQQVVCRLHRRLSWLGPWFRLDFAKDKSLFVRLKPRRNRAVWRCTGQQNMTLTGNLWSMNWRLVKDQEVLAKVCYQVKRAKRHYSITLYDEGVQDIVISLVTAVDFVKGLLKEY
ncbi:hypothetical protein [Streptococcus sp. DD12]|uniref:hypothetical protein n=1 Tax=Streptococcus sp. DD12 TaxID=1777880 RepID=UPI000796D3C3|nr:hypothetical protein [Streptococcus sp. DD12]KXT76206.1 hypothetical protein STRDD12_00702 [Streptococcus sp. DD12]